MCIRDRDNIIKPQRARCAGGLHHWRCDHAIWYEVSVLDIVCGKNPIASNQFQLGSTFLSRRGVPPACMWNIYKFSLTCWDTWASIHGPGVSLLRQQVQYIVRWMYTELELLMLDWILPIATYEFLHQVDKTRQKHMFKPHLICQFGQVILRKIIKIVATGSHISKL